MASSHGGRYACCLDRVSSGDAKATRVSSCFNLSLSLLILPLLLVLLRASFGSSFVVVAPSTKSWPLPQWRGGSDTSISMHQRSRSSEAQDQHQQLLLRRLPAPTASADLSRGNSKVLVFRESETRQHALQDEILEGVAAVIPPAVEVRKIKGGSSALYHVFRCGGRSAERTSQRACGTRGRHSRLPLLLLHLFHLPYQSVLVSAVISLTSVSLSPGLFLLPLVCCLLPGPDRKLESSPRAAGAATFRPRRRRFPRRLRL